MDNNTKLGKAKTVILWLTFFMLIFCIIKIIALDIKINNLQSSMNSQFSSVNSNISGISGSVSNALDQQDNIASTYSYNLVGADIDAENRCIANLSVTVTPKAYTSSTLAELVCDGVSYPMTLNGGVYSAALALPIGSTTGSTLFILTNGDEKQVQQLYLWETLSNDIFPNIYVDTSYSYGSKYFKLDGPISINLSNQTDFASSDITAATYILKINGEEKYSNDFNFPEDGSQAAYNSFDVRENFDCATGDNVEGYALAYTKDGLVYRVSSFNITIGGSSPELKNTTEVYNSEGVLITTISN